MSEKSIVSLEIRKVDRDTEMADKLLDFVDSYSWIDVNEHTYKYLKDITNYGNGTDRLYFKELK